MFKNFIGPDQELSQLTYFTSAPLNIDNTNRQRALFNANKLLNGEMFELVKGKYFNHDIKCPLCSQTFNRPTEKRTDVNIAIRMITDCFENKVDVLSLVTADTDLIPPIEYILDKFPTIKIKIYFPPSHFAYGLYDKVIKGNGKIIKLEEKVHLFRGSKIPYVVADDNKSYSIPEK